MKMTYCLALAPVRPMSAGPGLLLAAALLVAGCAGVPTPGERIARAQLRTAAEEYRPAGRRPDLPPLTSNSTLGDALRFAMLNQPAVEAAYYDWVASVERITTARSLPDPELTFEADIQDIVMTIMPGLMMNFPAPGKLRAGGNVATAESQAQYFAFQARVLESAYAVKRAYYQLVFLEEKIRVNRETLSLLTDLEKIARAQNEVGQVTLQDVLRAQIEQDRIRTEAENLEDSRPWLQEQWKAALGLRPDQAAAPLPQTFASTPLDLTPEKLLETVLATSTRLQALEAEVRAAQASLALAHKARLPDSRLGLMADAKMSPVLFRPLASISLPIWRDKIAAQIAAAQAGQRAAEARLTAEQIALAVAVAEKSFAYREATRNLELLQQQLLPRQIQSLDVARSGYLSGQIDFFNLTDTEQTLLRFRLDEVEARTQRELSLAELSLMMLGMPPGGTFSGADAGRMGSGSAPSPRKGSSGEMNRMN